MAQETEKRFEITDAESTIDSATDGWDPYIFSMVAGDNETYPEERRKKPRTRDGASRRAELAAQSRRLKGE